MKNFKRIAVVGEDGSGKSSVIDKLRGIPFNKKYRKTVCQKEFLINLDGEDVIVIDNPTDIRGCDEILYVVDLSCSNNYEKIYNCVEKLSRMYKVTVVATKSDISHETPNELLDQFNYIETSCKKDVWIKN